MPLAVILVLLDVTLVFHAVKTGRVRPWAFIILMVPGVGGLAYIVIELIPELLSGPEAQKARRRIANKLDPEKQYRLLSDQLETADTVANRAALAEECLEVARFDEARQHYEQILKQPAGDEPLYALGKARAEFALNLPADAIGTLDAMRSRWPDFESAEGHLLYARALVAAGRTEEALAEFHEVSQYFSGAEARVRYGLLLDQPRDRSQGGIHRAFDPDETCPEVCADGASRVAHDCRKVPGRLTLPRAGLRA
jgi:hypothetical protein